MKSTKLRTIRSMATKLLTMLGMLILLTAIDAPTASASDKGSSSKGTKTTICCVESGSTIQVNNDNQLNSHLAHGDYVGECQPEGGDDDSGSGDDDSGSGDDDSGSGEGNDQGEQEQEQESNNNSNSGDTQNQEQEQEQNQNRNGQDHVTICHIPPGNPANMHTITIGEPALAAHLRHGDPVGACEELFPEYFEDDDDSEDEEDDSETADDDSETEDDDSGTADDDTETADDPDPDPDPDPVDDEVTVDDVNDDGENLLDDPRGRDGQCSFLLEEGYEGKAGFYVLSSGNLDNDDSYGHFYRGATLNPACEIEGQPRVISENGLE